MAKLPVTRKQYEAQQVLEHKHHFVFLRQITQVVGYRNTKYYDVFYCDICLTEQRIEVDETLRNYDYTPGY